MMTLIRDTTLARVGNTTTFTAENAEFAENPEAVLLCDLGALCG
jgi:hypothetical protein